MRVAPSESSHVGQPAWLLSSLSRYGPVSTYCFGALLQASSTMSVMEAAKRMTLLRSGAARSTILSANHEVIMRYTDAGTP